MSIKVLFIPDIVFWLSFLLIKSNSFQQFKHHVKFHYKINPIKNHRIQHGIQKKRCKIALIAAFKRNIPYLL